jgi:hypothetical protein
MQVTQKIGMTHTAESVNTQIALDKVALIQTEIAGTQITQKRAMLDNITATAPFSTQQLVLKVGSRQTSEKDKMVMVYVPAGDFIMGYKDKQKQVYLDSFWIGFVAWK